MHLVKSLLPYRVHHAGFVLIETMISIVLVGVISIGFYSLFATHEVQKNRAEQYYLVQQDAKNVLLIMQRELNRAGYNLSSETANPFIYSNDQVYNLNARKDCILYRYDRNEDGVFSGENFGFRLHNGGIQLRKGSEVSCEGGLGWEMISNTASIDVTLLQFTIAQQYRLPQRVESYVTIALNIRHRHLVDIELNFFRNSRARALL
ncbi:prepilin-type N-terminal cleavage/methylation domain-containing protein [Moritella sp. 5]|uniref:prepilin-type N-terminal cleavage/methylation domain-containing protein n=1 Tax=Moritella sp. 5 TaxID=2746231 RepID=UPI0020133B42|nr:prepilin-type N-terminal cleavage/methylation domain-containing protein [Moritella sp. 5]